MYAFFKVDSGSLNYMNAIRTKVNLRTLQMQTYNVNVKSNFNFNQQSAMLYYAWI